MGVIYRYRNLKHMKESEKAKVTPRVVFFGGKAAPGYYMAKKIIKLINSVGEVINNDPSISPYLKVTFIPNYNVSKAEIIIPASDISQHISTAGMEASGTSNMKFVMNGGVIIGTLDGANIEIREEVRSKDYKPSTAFNQALGMIATGIFGPAAEFEDILNSISKGSDYYLVSFDFDSYIDAQERIDAAYKDKERWARMSILNSIRASKFSSDRTIHQYAKEIWKVDACRRPGPVTFSVCNPDDVTTPRTIMLEGRSCEQSDDTSRNQTDSVRVDFNL